MNRSTVFGKVIEGLMRPLVRALITQGITAPALYRIIKRLYVDVAENDFRIDETRQTDSRISVLTGVHRRDVKTYREGAGTPDTEIQEKVTTIASVLGKWLAGPETTDSQGRAMPLPRTATNGASFEDLVRSVSRDIRPRTVLDELVNQKLVLISSDDGSVHLNTDAFFGPADTEQKIHFFAENVGDHIAAAVDNLLAERPRFMERAVFYNRLTPASVDEIETAARSLGTEALSSLNSLANIKQSTDLDLPDSTVRFRFGVFFYREDEATLPTAGMPDKEDTDETI
ncbi:MAG: DUF6502 family protein [Pseudomonadota bacterium]